jgi:hypothetical protein
MRVKWRVFKEMMGRVGAATFIVSCTVSGASLAQPVTVYTCTLTGDDATMAVRFQIDRAQLAPPVSKDDPPRRVVAQVEMDGRRLVAEAVALPGGWAGFHSDAPPDVEILMIVDPEGAASLSIGDRMWRGACEASR